MPYLPSAQFQGDSANFYRYAEEEKESEEIRKEDDPFIGW